MNQTTRFLRKTCGESDSEDSIESATCIEGMKCQQEKTNKKCNNMSKISEKFEDKQEVNRIIANQTEDKSSYSANKEYFKIFDSTVKQLLQSAHKEWSAYNFLQLLISIHCL